MIKNSQKKKSETYKKKNSSSSSNSNNNNNNNNNNKLVSFDECRTILQAADHRANTTNLGRESTCTVTVGVCT